MTHIEMEISPEKFDRAVHGDSKSDCVVLRDGGDLAIYVKPKATEGGKAAVVLTFTVELPSGLKARAQTVVTANILEMAFGALKGWREGGHI